MADPRAPLAALLAAARETPAPDSVAGFLDAHARLDGTEPPAWRALRGGARAECLGFAFVAGYRAALDALVPGRPSSLSSLAALCATEAGGNHPRAIETTLDEHGRLRGHKAWITLGGAAETLLVVARTGEVDGRPALRLAAIRADAPGVRVTTVTPTPFVPEVPYAEAHFDGAMADHVFPGDGYTDYLKPFRTIEDVHVLGAFLGYALRALLVADDAARVERALLLATAIPTLASAPPRDPETHLAVAGLVDAVHAFADDAHDVLTAQDPRFSRDRALLRVASKARAARTEAARRALAPGPPVVPSAP